MSIASLPKMFVSETEGWTDVVKIHPSVYKLFFALVVPLSVLPPLMYAYAGLGHPGAVFPLTEPPMTGREAALVGGAFFLIELATVAFMAMVIRQIGNAHGLDTPYENAYALAAIAPVPLWLASLALFIPMLWANVAVVAVAWIGSVALIRHGVRPLLGVGDVDEAHAMANRVTMAGVAAWIALMVVLALLMSVFLGATLHAA
jgi:Yip1-like protein